MPAAVDFAVGPDFRPEMNVRKRQHGRFESAAIPRCLDKLFVIVLSHNGSRDGEGQGIRPRVRIEIKAIHL